MEPIGKRNRLKSGKGGKGISHMEGERKGNDFLGSPGAKQEGTGKWLRKSDKKKEYEGWERFWMYDRD
jgi:hypothetical protein